MGFYLKPMTAAGLLWALDEALRTYHMGREEWAHVVKNAMLCDYSWESSAVQYIALYEKLKEN